MDYLERLNEIKKNVLNQELIPFNDLKQNPAIFEEVKEFYRSLKEDKKIKRINNCNLGYWISFDDTVAFWNGYKITKSEVLDVTRLKVLLVIFMKDVPTKFYLYEELIPDTDKYCPFSEEIISTYEYEKTNQEETNNIYLYSDIIGNMIYKELEKFDAINWIKQWEPSCKNYAYYMHLSKKIEFPLAQLSLLLYLTSKCDDYYWLLIFFSQIKKQTYKKQNELIDSKESFKEELLKAKNLAEVIDLLVNMEIDDLFFKDFQESLREGYFNKSTLLTHLPI